jgi:hypothetical protein
MPEGTDICANIGFGGLDVFDFAIALPEDYVKELAILDGM